MYDIAVIGAGPAGMTAALYARRADKSVVLFEKNGFGGQITFSPKVENYPGIKQMSGNEFAELLVDQVMSHGTDVEFTEVTGVENDNGGFKIVTADGDFFAKSVIIASGSKHRMLGIDREEDFVGNGISFCAVCDGAFYAGKTVAVIGGGNSALQEAVMLAETSAKVYVVQNLKFLTGEPGLADILKKRDNVEIIYNSVVDSIVGADQLEGLILRDAENGAKTRIDIDGVFVAIGQIPENQPFADQIEIDGRGYAVAGEDCLTKTPGVFVAGDCRTKGVRQITTACGDGAVAAVAACRYLDSLK